MSKMRKNYNYDEIMHDILKGSEENDFDEVYYAISENPDCINQQDESTGMTALHISAGDGNFRMVSHLLSVPGIDIDIADKLGRDALSMAISIGHKGIIESISRRKFPKIFEPEDNSGKQQILKFQGPKPS